MHMYYDFLEISILTPWAAHFGRSAEGGLAPGRIPDFRAPIRLPWPGGRT